MEKTTAICPACITRFEVFDYDGLIEAIKHTEKCFPNFRKLIGSSPVGQYQPYSLTLTVYPKEELVEVKEDATTKAHS